MALFAPGTWQGVNQSMAIDREQVQARQMQVQRKQQMDYQNFQMDSERHKQMLADQAMQQSRQTAGFMMPPPQMPQAPNPGQASVPGGGMQPPQGQQPQPQPSGPPTVPPYRSLSGGGQPQQPGMQPQGQQPPAMPPAVGGQQSAYQLPTHEQLEQRMNEAGLADPLARQNAHETLQAKLDMQLGTRTKESQLAESQKRLGEIKAPQTRNVFNGTQETQQEFVDGKWQTYGQGPRFAKVPGVGGTGGGLSTTSFEKLSEKDQRTVDFYAKQSLGGDNSWQVGLARGKVGQQLIQRVKDRIPELAEATGQTAQDVSGTKAEMKALDKTLTDRVKYSTAVEQLQGTLSKQAELVESLIGKGASASGSPVLNKWLQAGRKATGDPDVRALNAAIIGLSREHQRVLGGPLSNAQLHASSAETADKLINSADTPESMRALIKVMRTEAANGKKQADETVKEIKGRISGLGRGNAKPETSSEDKAAMEWAKANPSDPRAKKILSMQGG